MCRVWAHNGLCPGPERFHQHRLISVSPHSSWEPGAARRDSIFVPDSPGDKRDKRSGLARKEGSLLEFPGLSWTAPLISQSSNPGHFLSLMQ